jgi:uncharacterized membrane protein
MFVFGREAWLRSGDVFAVYFGQLARLAPFEVQVKGGTACEWNLRPPAAGLLDSQPASPSAAAFVIVMLATVTFDGVRETPLWAGLLARMSQPGEPVSDLLWSASATAGLLLVPCIFALVILGACALMARLTRGDARAASAAELARLFVPTLLPIAFAYHVAHYLSYLLVAGQVVIPLASDPFGRGWDLFGTAHYRVAVGIVGARFAWYTSVLVIVLGHVLAMYLAHRLALERFSDRRTARRSQYPLAALMVAYTMLSLWILAQPIVDAGPAK